MISNKGAPTHVALIGVTGYATVYVDWLVEAHRRRRVRIVALNVLPSQQHLPIVEQLKALGAQVFGTYEELFGPDAPRLDLCYIPTGIQWHARMAIAALESGCNVLVEKPLAGSMQDVLRVQETEKATGRWVAVGFQDMYTKDIEWLKRTLLDGAIGKIEAVSMLGAWPRPTAYYQRNHWAGKLQADGAYVLDSPLNNAFAHFINLALYLAGPGLNLSSQAKVVSANLYRAHRIESFDTAVVRAKSQTNVAFWFGVTHACRAQIEPSIRIIGDQGHAEWSHEQTCTLYAGNSVLHTRDVPKYATTRSEMFENVIDRLENPKARICDTAIASCHTALIEDVHRSSPIRTVSESQIDHCSLDEAGAKVPAIRNVEARLQEAFANREPVEGIECLPANV